MDLKPPLPAIVAGVVLIVLLEFLVGGYSGYGFGFYAWFGFGSCVVLIVAALALGKVLKRKDDYYDARADGPDDGRDAGRDAGQGDRRDSGAAERR